jgi:hypothetical protein
MNLPKNNKQLVPLTSEKIYHSLDNRYLTNSRIGDLLKDKQFFKERHITGERPGIVETDALKVGKAVDTYIFDGEKAFREKFIAVTRRNHKNPPTSVTELTEKQYNDIDAMANVLLAQPAIKELENHRKQEIITMDMDLGDHFCGLAAIPDWWTIEGDTAIITDLKTSYETDENKYHWKCISYGYYRQMAVMAIIIKNNHPEVKNFVYRHITIEKDKDSIFTPFAFVLANEQIEAQEQYILNDILPTIKQEKDFLPHIAEWKTASVIGAIEEYKEL